MLAIARDELLRAGAENTTLTIPCWPKKNEPWLVKPPPKGSGLSVQVDDATGTAGDLIEAACRRKDVVSFRRPP